MLRINIRFRWKVQAGEKRSEGEEKKKRRGNESKGREESAWKPVRWDHWSESSPTISLFQLLPFFSSTVSCWTSRNEWRCRWREKGRLTWKKIVAEKRETRRRMLLLFHQKRKKRMNESREREPGWRESGCRFPFEVLSLFSSTTVSHTCLYSKDKILFPKQVAQEDWVYFYDDVSLPLSSVVSSCYSLSSSLTGFFLDFFVASLVILFLWKKEERKLPVVLQSTFQTTILPLSSKSFCCYSRS